MKKEFIVEVSARHVHVTKETLEKLFGKGHELTPKKDLSQPGQFACEEKVTIVGEKGSLKASILGPCRPEDQVEVSEGVIAAKRHIHMTVADGERFGITDKQIVKVKIPTEGRALIFDDVVARVSDKYALAMHIDTDEANAAALSGSIMGEIVE